MSEKKFLSGDEAFAEGVRLARPKVVSAYPITPQTIVVERLSEMCEKGELEAEFIHVESEHSAMMSAMGAQSVGARTFTATSSQGLLYMAECLPYVAGGRFPIVMMNANRATALPWSIFGDQRDSISQLDCGWIQIYVENAQESLDMALQSYYLAEHESVRLPVMVNLDGFVLTHTYEIVEIPDSDKADEFLPEYTTTNKMDLDHPKSLAYTVGPEANTEFLVLHHRAMQKVESVIEQVDRRYEEIFGRSYGGLTVNYKTEDADYVMVTLGSITGLVREVADELREEGMRVGVIKLRFLRPFPNRALAEALRTVKSVGVLEKDLSFGNEGTVYTNVNSALVKEGIGIPSINFIAGLGGRNISKENIRDCFHMLADPKDHESVQFIGLEAIDDVR